MLAAMARTAPVLDPVLVPVLVPVLDEDVEFESGQGGGVEDGGFFGKGGKGEENSDGDEVPARARLRRDDALPRVGQPNLWPKSGLYTGRGLQGLAGG